MILGANDYWKKMFSMIRKGIPLPMKGTNSFQVIYVKDLVKALIRVMEKGETGEIYLAAGKEAITLNEVYILVRKLFGQSEKVNHIPSFLGMGIGKIFGIKLISAENIRHLSKERKYNIAKISEIGWEPKYTLKEALTEVIDGFEKQNN